MIVPKLETSILLKQIKTVNESIKLTILTSVVLGAILGLQVYEVLNTSYLILWITVLLTSIFFRVFLFFKSKNEPPNRKNIKRWIQYCFVNTALSAISYGLIAGSVGFIIDPVALTIVYIIMAGATAAAVTVYGSLKHLSNIFIFPILIPAIIANILFGDLKHFILSGITLLFCYIIYSASNILYKTLLNTLEQNNVIRNLTEEKVRMEEMAKLKSDFFASMSHEIRTPLNGIVGLVDLLSGSEVNEQQKHYLSTIKSSSDDLLNVINDVLDLSKIESKKLELLPKKTSLPEFTKRMVTLFSEKAKNKNLNLHLTINENIPEYVEVDEHRLSQIISNLLSNAIKFTKIGSVHLYVDVVSQKNNIAVVEFKIQDTGIGVPEEKQELIFNKYNQIANSTNYILTQAGTGLGLSIAKQLTNLMEGEIGLHSKEKEGSTFWVKIEMPILNQKDAITDDVRIKNIDQYNFNVLLVDDRDVNLKVASLMLKKLGCEVETAQNGEVAIAKYDENPTKFDLIIMDIQMPVMDGINATKTLRKKYAENLAPIYGLSAQIPKNLNKTPKELGFDFYLTKPLSLETLKQSLNKIA
ncbi:MAG: hypothetical protein CMD20_02725 [Flavobacteriales bacterium]|nr:hypothetical protein [Flavobacteriales bacterium]